MGEEEGNALAGGVVRGQHSPWPMVAIRDRIEKTILTYLERIEPCGVLFPSSEEAHTIDTG